MYPKEIHNQIFTNEMMIGIYFKIIKEVGKEMNMDLKGLAMG